MLHWNVVEYHTYRCPSQRVTRVFEKQHTTRIALYEVYCPIDIHVIRGDCVSEECIFKITLALYL